MHPEQSGFAAEAGWDFEKGAAGRSSEGDDSLVVGGVGSVRDAEGRLAWRTGMCAEDSCAATAALRRIWDRWDKEFAGAARRCGLDVGKPSWASGSAEDLL